MYKLTHCPLLAHLYAQKDCKKSSLKKSLSYKTYIFFSKSIFFGENVKLVVKKDSVIKLFTLKHCIAAFSEQKTTTILNTLIFL